MNIVSILFLLIIRPLELFFEVVFSFANRIVQNPGLSIIFLSLSMNFLVLPLYRRADQMQEEERDISAKLAPVIAHIKKTFKGDQRFMMLQTYYRHNNYKNRPGPFQTLLHPCVFPFLPGSRSNSPY